MNYVLHLNQVQERFATDKRIIPRHVSMYMALFFLWNKFKFPEAVHIVRHELMVLSKIGSLKYYYQTLNELDEWGYVDYEPSKSSYQASCVKMRTCFNSGTSSGTSTATTGGTSSATSSETTSASSTATSGATTSSTSSGTTGESINKTVINNTNSKETVENKSGCTGATHPSNEQTEKKGRTGKKTDKVKGFQKPALAELKDYFEEREAPAEEAERFFNHFESNGWKVGGKSPMKDWKAAVRNWILNMSKYEGPKAEVNPLATKNDKDYGEPL